MNGAELTGLLVDLGLSSLEVKVYLALVRLDCEPVTAKALSDAAEVNRQDTYRVLSDLINRGIVEKILGDPLKFRGLPLKTGISILLKQRANKYLDVKKRSLQALKTYKKNEEKYAPETQLFTITANLESFIVKLENELKNANSTIEMVYTKERMAIISFHLLEELQHALDRGVRASIITTRASNKEFERNLQALHKVDVLYENLEVRVVEEPLDIGLALFDSNKCYIRTAQSLGHSLFSNNAHITALASYYFKSEWEKAAKTSQII